MEYKDAKILYLITGLNLGGGEHLLLDIIPRLDMPKSHIKIVCMMDPGVVYTKLLELSFDVINLDIRKKPIVFNLVKGSFIFYKIIRQFKPDIIHTHLIHADLFGRIIGKLAGVKIIITTVHVKLLERKYLLFLDRITSFLVTQYIAVSKIVEEYTIKELKLNSDKVITIDNGVDINKFMDCMVDRDKKRNELGLSASDKVIGCVANLRTQKGQKSLILALPDIVKVHGSKIRLLLIGDGPCDGELRRVVAESGLQKNVLFLGHRADVPELLKIFDLFVLPSLFEGLPLILIEAAAAGCVIIASDIPENHYVLDALQTGYFFKLTDIKDLSFLITARLKTVGELRSQIPIRLFNQFDVNLMTEKLCKLYTAILSR